MTKSIFSVLALTPAARWLSVLLILAAGASSPWSVQTNLADTNLRGVSVSRGGGHNFVWVSGSKGVIARSVNDGATWKQLPVAGGADLDFRDVEAFGPDVAYAMSSGPGDKSRIYKTSDGGKTWKLQHSDRRPAFFLDSLACESAKHYLALSDPVDGKFLLLNTDDGEHWRALPHEKMPAALPQEGAFAASGTALALCSGKILFATGGPAARLFVSDDYGLSWKVTSVPLASGNPSSGVFSIACGTNGQVIAVGGDYKDPLRAQQVAAYSQDSGATWHPARTQPGGYRSAVGRVANGDFIAVGPNGTDVSRDGGMHWEHTEAIELNAISFHGEEGWAVGPKGAIARFVSHRPASGVE